MHTDLFVIDPYFGWLLFGLAGVIVGSEKGGLAGIGILAIPIMASIFPAARSVGILLPLLICGDILGIYFYRKSVVISEVLKALPLVIIGIVCGYLVLKYYPIDDTGLKRLIGAIVLFMLIFSEWQRRNNSGKLPERNLIIMISLAFLGGFTSMLANAAGPVLTLYLLYLGMNKEEFMGVRSWIFLVLNGIKIPFHVDLGNITLESLHMDLYIIPAIALGFFLGFKLLKRLPERSFNIIIKTLACVACLKLLFF